MQYPKDWTYNETGYDETFPDRIFNVIFLSPSHSLNDLASFSVSIENLNPSANTLDEYKNRIELNLKDSESDKVVPVKDLSILPSTLAGNPAYSFEYMIRLGDVWQKSISLDSISNGKLYEVSTLGDQATIDKYSEDFKKMIESVKFEQSGIQSNVESTTQPSIQPSNPPESPSTSSQEVSEKDQSGNCDSSYPDFCIPSPPPDLNCADISQKRFTVTGSDHMVLIVTEME